MNMEEITMENKPIDYISENHLTRDETQVTENEMNVGSTYYQIPGLFTTKTLLELSNSTWSRSRKADENFQPYLRGCKWSPDGTCCLCVVNNDGVHVTELSRELYTDDVASGRHIDVLDSVIHVKEAGLVYDFCWYPTMNSAIPETSCWLTTIQNSPLQMWDAFNGSLRCSYRGYNAVDEVEAALSVTFSSDAKRIIAGYKKALRTFDVERPGRDYVEHKTISPASCMAINSNLLAVGSWNTTISLYNVSETGTYKSIGKMHGHAGGITHLKFAPDGLKLVSGARKDHRLLVWDIRYYRRPLNILHRVVNTNQRVYFDISPCGQYLVTGGTDGILKVWDSCKNDWLTGRDVSDEGDNATYKFPLHKDCCNSVSIHPCRPILATGSGQHHLTNPITKLNDELSNDSQNDTQDSTDDTDIKYSTSAENSLVFWWTGDVLL